MSIKDWKTVENTTKIKKVLVLSNIWWNFEKKIRGIFGKSWENFENLLRKFLRNLGKL